MAGMQPSTTARRLGWFVLLYLAGLAVAGAVLYLLRWLLGFVFGQ